MPGGHKPIRLPPLKTLRVHNPKRQVENPCIAIMSSVLGVSFYLALFLPWELHPFNYPMPHALATQLAQFDLEAFGSYILSSLFAVALSVEIKLYPHITPCTNYSTCYQDL